MKANNNTTTVTGRPATFSNANSYATYANAVKKLRSVLGDTFNNVHWLIVSQEDGRFSPAVIAHNKPELTYLIHCGICVIG